MVQFKSKIQISFYSHTRKKQFQVLILLDIAQHYHSTPTDSLHNVEWHTYLL